MIQTVLVELDLPHAYGGELYENGGWSQTERRNKCQR